MASIKVTIDTELEASPAEVFAAVSDPARMPDWVSGVEKSAWAEGATLKPGDRFEMLYNYGRRTNEITMEIISVEPGSRLEYKTVEGPYPIHVDMKLSPNGTGTSLSYTQTAFSDSMMTAFAFMVTRWLAKPMMRRALSKDLLKLDAVAAGSAPETED